MATTVPGARSVAARSALEGSGFDLALLGTRSLGELLFSDSAFERGPSKSAAIRRPVCPPRSAPRVSGAVAHGFRGALGVLVAEVFLPSLWDQAGIADA